MIALYKKIAETIGYMLAVQVTRNNQPHMSGDPRNRMLPHIRKRFDEDCMGASFAVIDDIHEAGMVLISKEDAEETLMWLSCYEGDRRVGQNDPKFAKDDEIRRRIQQAIAVANAPRSPR